MRYDNVLWTMQIEFYGSFLVFGMLALFGRLQRRWLVYALLAILLRHTYYLAFVIGLALCDWVVMRRREGKPAGGSWLGWFALAQGLALGAMEGVIGPTAQILGAALVMCGLVMLAPVQRALTTAPARYLGRVSFSLYVVHILVIASLGCGLFVALYHPLGYAGAAVVSIAVSLVVVLGAAELLTHFVDEPAIRRSGEMYRRLFAGPTANPAEQAAAVATKAQPEHVVGASQ
jgi:peptidoglycan/LPS O-acetylase OafA/YrhL